MRMNPLKEVITSNEIRRRGYIIREGGERAVVSPMNQSTFTEVLFERL